MNREAGGQGQENEKNEIPVLPELTKGLSPCRLYRIFLLSY